MSSIPKQFGERIEEIRLQRVKSLVDVRCPWTISRSLGRGRFGFELVSQYNVDGVNWKVENFWSAETLVMSYVDIQRAAIHSTYIKKTYTASEWFFF